MSDAIKPSRTSEGAFGAALAAAAFFCAVSSSGVAHAQTVRTDPKGPVVSCGESQYQLVYAADGRRGITWQQAEQAATELRHSGRRGRLAIIEDMDTHSCVRTNLVSGVDNEVWIGLRYWCPYQMLQWSTGDIRPSGKASPWAVQWSRYNKCGTKYMGFYYTLDTKRWQAVELSKRFSFFLVEYPPNE